MKSTRPRACKLQMADNQQTLCTAPTIHTQQASTATHTSLRRSTLHRVPIGKSNSTRYQVAGAAATSTRRVLPLGQASSWGQGTGRARPGPPKMAQKEAQERREGRRQGEKRSWRKSSLQSWLCLCQGALIASKTEMGHPLGCCKITIWMNMRIMVVMVMRIPWPVGAPLPGSLRTSCLNWIPSTASIRLVIRTRWAGARVAKVARLGWRTVVVQCMSWQLPRRANPPNNRVTYNSSNACKACQTCLQIRPRTQMVAWAWAWTCTDCHWGCTTAIWARRRSRHGGSRQTSALCLRSIRTTAGTRTRSITHRACTRMAHGKTPMPIPIRREIIGGKALDPWWKARCMATTTTTTIIKPRLGAQLTADININISINININTRACSDAAPWTTSHTSHTHRHCWAQCLLEARQEVKCHTHSQAPFCLRRRCHKRCTGRSKGSSLSSTLGSTSRVATLSHTTTTTLCPASSTRISSTPVQTGATGGQGQGHCKTAWI